MSRQLNLLQGGDCADPGVLCLGEGVLVCEGMRGASDLDGGPNKGERLFSCKATEGKGPSRKPADWEFDVWPVVSSSPRRTV